MKKIKLSKPLYLNSKTVFTISILIAVLVPLAIWLFGIDKNQTLVMNSLLSVSLLSITFFLFISIGLYHGAKLKDNMGEIVRFKEDGSGVLESIDTVSLDGILNNPMTETTVSNNERMASVDNADSIAEIDGSGLDFPDIGDGIEGIIISIVLWFLISVLLTFGVWFFVNFIWVIALLFIAMLYWVFFRAVRLVFKHSKECKGQLIKSIAYGLGYTTLYSSWIYGIIWFHDFLK